MRIETLLVILASVTAAAFVFQCLAVWLTTRNVRLVAQRLEQQSQGLQRDLSGIVNTTRELVESLKPLSRMAEEVSTSTTQIAQMVRDRGKDLDHFVQDMVKLSRAQATKIDYVVTDTVQKFEQITEVIQRDVLQPVIEISSFVKGLKSGLGYLFSRRTARPAETFPEEELFI